MSQENPTKKIKIEVVEVKEHPWIVLLREISEKMLQVALSTEQKQLVAEACLGLFILNFPPPELVEVIFKVSQKLLQVVKKSSTSEINEITKYIASTNEQYFGVLQEEPIENSSEQFEKVLTCDSDLYGAPMLSLHLNAHRTVLKLIGGIKSQKIVIFQSGTERKRNKKTEKVVSYGASNITNISVGETQKHVPASSTFIIEYPDNYDHFMPNVGSDSLTSRDLLRLAKWMNLTKEEERWYCLGILGFLLAPAAHSFREVASIVNENQIALFTPCYRYCGFLEYELSKNEWFKPLVKKFGGVGFYGELPFVIHDLKRVFRDPNIVKLIVEFMGLPYINVVLKKNK